MKTVVAKDITGATFTVAADKLVWRPSAYGIVIHNGAILLLKQQTGYDLPGGGIELGETCEDAVIREVKEESGMDVKSPRLLAVDTSFFKLPAREDDVFVHSPMLYYACEYVGGAFSNAGFDDWEKEYAEGAEWVPLTDLETLTIASSNDYRKHVRSLFS